MANDLQLVSVSYWWLPPTPYREESSEVKLAENIEQVRMPRIGQTMTWIMPRPRTVGYEPPIVVGYGRVTHIERVEPRQYGAYVERENAVGLGYDELCALINVSVVGFHPDLGCVEGALIGLLPESELAGVADPAQASRIRASADDDTGDEDDEPVVWVDWATIRPLAMWGDDREGHRGFEQQPRARRAKRR
jgi:hypothetical protein